MHHDYPALADCLRQILHDLEKDLEDYEREPGHNEEEEAKDGGSDAAGLEYDPQLAIKLKWLSFPKVFKVKKMLAHSSEKAQDCMVYGLQFMK